MVCWFLLNGSFERYHIYIFLIYKIFIFFFSSRRRHTRLTCDWSSDVCSSDLPDPIRGYQRGVAGKKVVVGNCRSRGAILIFCQRGEAQTLPHCFPWPSRR